MLLLKAKKLTGQPDTGGTGALTEVDSTKQTAPASATLTKKRSRKKPNEKKDPTAT